MSSSVRDPIRAAAEAASQPACPPPTPVSVFNQLIALDEGNLSYRQLGFVGKHTPHARTGPRRMLVPELQVFVLLTVHLGVRPGRLVLLTAEVQHAVHHYPAHFAEGRGAVDPGVVAHRIHVYEDIAGYNPLPFQVAVIEGDDVGEIVVSEKLPVHLQQAAGRAEDVGHVSKPIALAAGHLLQPSGRQPLLRQRIGTVVVVVFYSHNNRISSVGIIS